ncbi:MAG: transporter substrate-binding domain-containing protein [Rhodoferax sp.]|nr:MAG: transporter substrate-binding domain-containing protein [Rhodoferax sp.]
MTCSAVKRWVLIWLLALGASALWAQSPTVVKVGVYPFLPFSDGRTGLTHELVQALNAFQSEYRFETVPTSANRRYRDMADGVYSHIFFESVKWGWQPDQVDTSKVYLKGDGEVFVARAQRGRGQEYFQTLADKDILAVLGYRYAFADFEADPDLLRKHFSITFSTDNAVILRNLLAGRGDVAVLTKSYLNRYLVEQPKDRGLLLISQRMDQAYAHTALVAKGAHPSAQELNRLFTQMEAEGVLGKLWAAYGMAP